MEVVQVQPRDSYLHYVYVPSRNTCIRWSFTTKNKNIGFGLYRRKGTSLPSSSNIIFRAHQPVEQRQLTAPPRDLYNAEQDDAENSCADDLPACNESLYSNNNAAYNRPRAKSVASIQLKEQGLDEILPIYRTNSSNTKIEGSYTVDEPGNYVLVFGKNLHIVHKGVLCSFSVALADAQTTIDAEPKSGVSGWLLKKKRKRMQGWAKRWFQLSSSGLLSYATSPGNVIRGSIQIMVSTISVNPKQRSIHIDSGTVVYHLKALTVEDHEKWTEALRAYRSYAREEEDLDTTAAHQEDHADIHHVNGTHEHSESAQLEIERGIEEVKRLIHLAANMRRKADTFFGQLDGDESLAASIADYRQDQETLRQLADQQYTQWNRAKEAISSTPLTNPRVNRLSHQQQPSPRSHSIQLSRSDSARSCASTYSDQFFDAEDIIINGDEEEDEDDSDLVVDNDSDDEESNESNEISDEGRDSALDLTSLSDCHRRSTLPSVAVGDIGSALSVFRKNVGKDLSTISMPINMNEPLNLLQKACEDLEYSELLDKASTLSNSMDRLVHVAVFAVSSYASSQYRTGRKPFNPMMSETYECIRPDKGFRYIAEKVSHNPLIIAAHAESKNYKFWQCTKVKSKFWGKSMEFMTEGNFHVQLTGHDDHFTYSKPSSWMRNMIAGEKYLEHAGELCIRNHNTNEYAIITFKEGTGGGLFGTPTKRNEVIATFYDASDKKCRRVVGKWSDKLAEEVDMNKRQLSVLWTANPPGIEDYAKYYGFTKFCIELNEITSIEQGKLPKTDTRLRPDQRMYEEGLVDEADAEKQRIEQKQRDRRKELEQQGVPWEPRWFVLQDDAFAEPGFIPSSNESQSWQYNGQYWQSREAQQWPSDLLDLW
ncbi:Oxysterol-binding protein-domain-containing protein [Radiomyces spectabilis]|uniref:Oxysterol-binding protein-domain-containing protein n=1 Tax=Radiomyces spectabilis TaxID=64574 RepID=UPI002220F58B|nr:Oxysterol-binding protein-domain-containing protein [Radiomyces spectabilis]KAI8388923.1 Oxysterol-binding protein-domain-containing protein [Radiomyces spectabilis]